MPVDTCVGIVDPYAKPWARKGQELIFFFLNDRLEFRKKGREAGWGGGRKVEEDLPDSDETLLGNRTEGAQKMPQKILEETETK